MKRNPKAWRAWAILMLGFLHLNVYPKDTQETQRDFSFEEEKRARLVYMVKEILSYYHFSVKTLDKKYANQAYDLYLTRIDPNKRILLKSDSIALSAFRDKVHVQMQTGDFALFQTAYQITTDRLQDIQRYIKETLDNPIDFETKESIYLDDKKRPYPADTTAQRELWRKYVKYLVLENLYDRLNDKKADTVLTFEQAESKAKKSVQDMLGNWQKRIQKIKEDDAFDIFINSLVGVFDPHSGYFSPKNKDDFDASMSGQFEGIGARLSTKDDFVTINEVIAGGPAYRQGELQVGDKIIKVAQDGKEPVSLQGVALEDATALIKGKKGTLVRLTVKKSDGTQKEITIKRDIVIIEETFAKSLLLKKDDKKIGYIYLPSFYINLNDSKGRRCADDVRNEIDKLRRYDLQGLIIDLRNNPGGSLSDVVKMGSYFVGNNPIVQVMEREGKKQVLKDFGAPSVPYYDGALVIMVNNYSASASEILAGVIQDYNRGIILGSDHTFGKGTVQRFFELDQIAPEPFQMYKPFGSLKMSTQKFYRVDGTSTQLKGVRSDIILPSLYDLNEEREKDLDYAMPWDVTSAAKYKALDLKEKTKYIANSQKRIKNNFYFNLTKEKVALIKQKTDKKDLPLAFADYKDYVDKTEQSIKKYDTLNNMKTKLKADFVNGNASKEKDSMRIELGKKFVTNVEKDFYIEEAVQVILDMKKS